MLCWNGFKMGLFFVFMLYGFDYDEIKVIVSINSVQCEVFIVIYRFYIEVDWVLFLNKYN